MSDGAVPSHTCPTHSSTFGCGMTINKPIWIWPPKRRHHLQYDRDQDFSICPLQPKNKMFLFAVQTLYIVGCNLTFFFVPDPKCHGNLNGPIFRIIVYVQKQGINDSIQSRITYTLWGVQTVTAHVPYGMADLRGLRGLIIQCQQYLIE